MSLNRYVIDGMLLDLQLARRVLVVSADPVRMRHAFESVDQRIGVKPSLLDAAEIHSVSRVNGGERIYGKAGGWIRFVDLVGLHLHLAVDVLVLTSDLDDELCGRIHTEVAIALRSEADALEVIRL